MDAATYSEANWLTRRDVHEILARFTDSMCWTPGELILDIGCGPGDITAEILLTALPADIGKIVGIDLSHAMVEHAAASQRHHKLCFTQMDIATKQLDKVKLAEMTRAKQLDKDRLGEMTRAKQLDKDRLGEMTDTKQLDKPHMDGVFNKVFSFFCLHWVQDQKLAIKNVYELMKPGGEGLVLFFSNIPVFDMYEVLAENPKWSPYMKDARSHISPYQKSSDPLAEFNAFLSEAGFVVNTCINESRSFPYETVTHLKRIMGAVDPFIKRIPELLRDAYMSDCISELGKMKSIGFFDRNNPNEDGHVVTQNYELIVAHFSKLSSVTSSTKLADNNMG